MSDKTYLVKKTFLTVQGEGVNAGRAAVFVRLAACNMWDGHPDHREEWHARTGAACALFCDTEFHPGDADGEAPATKMTALDLAKQIQRDFKDCPSNLVVLTGGEPLLQADADLFLTLRSSGFSVAVETNGTVSLVDKLFKKEYVTTKAAVEANDGHFSREEAWRRDRGQDLRKHFQSVISNRGATVSAAPDYVTVSPKLPPEATKIRALTELKCVVPQYDPMDYASLVAHVARTHAGPLIWVQPCDDPEFEANAAVAVMAAATKTVRISVQTHKILNVE